MDANVLIEASAGTGKTQALAQRLIDLLRLGVKPQEIVALTFSRAAAGEIFQRFVSLLAESAATDPADAKLLREVLATQHLSQIGTLDSFLMRIVRAFPLELGLSGEIEMMDDYRAKSAAAAVSFSILRRTDEQTRRAFVEAFSLAMNREDVRSFVATYRKFIHDWHELVMAFPDESAWGDATAIWGRESAFARVTERELALAADGIAGLADTDAWREFTDWVRRFRGRFGTLTGVAKKLLDPDTALAGDLISFTYNRRKYDFGREATNRVRDAIACVYGFVIRQKLELARGVYRVISAFESEYAKSVRATGKLVFADVPRLIAALPETRRLALEYRLDSRIRAWALDEFQDTSREQWGALRDLIDEAKQSAGEKSVFIVGDCKQAIYGWRNGDVGIFRNEAASGAYRAGALVKTYRSGPAVVEAVNRVFARGRIRDEFPAWTSPEHETARPELGGFVRVEDAPGRTMEDFVEPVYEALKANAAKGLSVAVLVRNNAFGELLADGLKARGLPGVVWEGESAVLDTPALSGFLDLLQLADHPGDSLTYRHFRLTPLCAAKYPDGVPDAAAVSREMALAFTTRGLVRTLRELRALLPEDPAVAWSAFTEERFTEMLRAAATFELQMSAGSRLADFAGFLAGLRKRNVAEADKIKIMTIHRSKGLGFDYVVLPLYEHEGLTSEAEGPLLGDGWILPDPTARVAKGVGGLEDAYRLRKDRVEQEALCTYYVAMTRAKRGMTVILHPAGSSLRFSDLVRSAELGDLTHPEFAFAPQTVALRPHAEGLYGADESRPPRAPRTVIRRRLPSRGFAEGQSAGDLFRASARSEAMKRGTAAHAAYERIAWLDASAAKTDFDRALVKPADATALWREKAFEVFADGKWTSGCFDRVVFRGAGEARRAVIYDFKTNACRRGESVADFESRMRSAYASQLADYRSAVCALTGIPAERVETVLLLAATQTQVRT